MVGQIMAERPYAAIQGGYIRVVIEEHIAFNGLQLLEAPMMKGCEKQHNDYEYAYIDQSYITKESADVGKFECRIVDKAVCAGFEHGNLIADICNKCHQEENQADFIRYFLQESVDFPSENVINCNRLKQADYYTYTIYYIECRVCGIFG